MDLSDHSSVDDDYDPTKDEERDFDEEEGAPIRPLEAALKKISRRRAHAAEDLFKSMLSEEKCTLEKLRDKTELLNKAKRSSGDVLETVLEKSMKQAKNLTRNSNQDWWNLIHEDYCDNKEVKKRKKRKVAVTKAERNHKILSKIFGKTKASVILDSMGKYELLVPKPPPNTKKASRTSKKGLESYDNFGSTGAVRATTPTTKHGNPIPKELGVSIKASIKASLKNIARKTKIVEKRKFAGQEITIERSEMTVKSQFDDDDVVGQASRSSHGSGGTGALDSVLDTIKGPKTISTVTKSAFDWQSHKTKEGLEDELAPASKDGYLARQDFLTRVDVRTFEKERDERLRQQTSTRSQA